MAQIQYSKPPMTLAIPPVRGGRALSIPTVSAGTTGVHYNFTFTNWTNLGLFGPTDLLASLVNNNVGSGDSIKAPASGGQGNMQYHWYNQPATSTLASVGNTPGEDFQTSDSNSVTLIPMYGAYRMKVNLSIIDTVAPTTSYFKCDVIRFLNLNDATTFFSGGGTNTQMLMHRLGPFNSARKAVDGETLGDAEQMIAANCFTTDYIEMTSSIFSIMISSSSANSCGIVGDLFFVGP